MALTAADYKAAIRAAEDLSGIIKWSSTNATSGYNKIMDLIAQAVKNQWKTDRLLTQIRGLAVYTKYVEASGSTDPEEEPVEEGDFIICPSCGYPNPWDSSYCTNCGNSLVEEPKEEEDPWMAYQEQLRQEDVRAAISAYLLEWGLTGLDSWVENAIQQKWPLERILLELRQHPVYLAVFPENEMRKAAGYAWMPESEILAYRDEARRLAQQYLGLDVSNMEISGLIAGNVSLSEWERRLETWNNVNRWGDAVRQVFEMELGYTISDDRMWAFMNPDIPTPDLDMAYERALMRGQPAVLGLSIRPEEEADLLQQFGISAEEAFKGYQGIVQEMPRFEKYRYIEAFLRGREDLFPTGAESLAGVNFSTLFRALQLGDPDALAELRALQAREVSRFQAQGGPGRRETGKSGLLGRFEW